MSVKKVGKKFVVTSKSGGQVLGHHSTKKGALKQLRAIEASKSRRGK